MERRGGDGHQHLQVGLPALSPDFLLFIYSFLIRFSFFGPAGPERRATSVMNWFHCDTTVHTWTSAAGGRRLLQYGSSKSSLHMTSWGKKQKKSSIDFSFSLFLMFQRENLLAALDRVAGGDPGESFKSNLKYKENHLDN